MAKDIKQWLDELDLGKFGDLFVEHDIDLAALPHITNEDLKELGIKVGARRKIQAAIQDLRKAAPPGAGEGSAKVQDLASPIPHGAAERRQLTVMFCDLVGSTELSRSLDPEDLRALMRRYQDAVAGAVSRYGGHIAKYLGDGVLTYFGWPQAYEDQAERAIRAGLEAASAVESISLDDRGSLGARVGISSGEVIVGDLVGAASLDSQAVTGETPNLAARLQAIAEPGQVVIGATTRRLVGNTFELTNLGPQKLKGFSESPAAWSVDGEGEAESRFEAAHAGPLGRFVGREHELGLIADRWTLAKSCEGQIVLLTGEAGMGKSRLVRALRERIGEERHFRLRYQCSPHHTNSALYPVIQRLEKAAGFSFEDSGETKLDKLEALLRISEPDIAKVAPLFAALLSLPGDERYGAIDLERKQLRDRTIEAMIGQVLALTRERPVLFVLEDAHWIDPTTEALITEIMPRIAEARVLILITHRPDYSPPWIGLHHLTSVALSRLSRKQSMELVAAAGGGDLPQKVREKILERSEGMPLFLEELTRSVLEGGRGDAKQAIPTTLHASLMARLDRLGEAKEIAQIGAAIGREFSYGLVAATADRGEAELRSKLGKLVASGLVFQRGTPPEANYMFKHALVQDEAYGSVLRDRRRQLHLRIAKTIEADFADLADSEPELLAHHLTEAGNLAYAIPYWLRAAQRAASASAYAEAEQLSKIALGLLQKLPGSLERDTQELKLLLTLGSVLMSTRGFAARKVGEVYSQAHRICQEVGGTSEKFAATWGYWMFSYQSGARGRAKSLATEALAITQEDQDSGRRLQAHHAAWTHLSVTGDLIECQEHIQHGKALHDLETHRNHANLFGGHDPGVCCWNHAGMIDWVMGYPEDARKDIETSRALADQLAHPFSQMLSRVFSCWVYQHRREAAETVAMAAEAMTLSTEHGFHQYTGVIAILDAWARADSMSGSKCFKQLQEGLAKFRATGSSARLSYFLSVVADACLKIGKVDDGLRAVEDGLQCVKKHEQTRWEPELHRLRGNLMSKQPNRDLVELENTYRMALDIAHKQGAKSLELRAAVDLARFLKNKGKPHEAHDLLKPIFDWFTQGFDTPDLKDARVVLDELS